ncbi:MAG: hypothetical protein E6I43_06005 [Chloroflexi bacterium]|nr:MAG: hypothetical protein E6I43_06005 [Chloroflexota bacterium]
MMNDPELEELFQDPAHREVVDLLKMSRPAAPPLDPNFRTYLRTKLMTEARRTLEPRAARRGFPFNLGPKALAPAMAAVAAGFLVVLGIQIYLHNQSPTSAMVAVDLSHLQNKTNVATGEPIVIRFTGPIDKNAIADTVVIEPATSVTKQWVGQNLVIIPDHPLAPNTTYTVSLKPRAVPPTPNPAKPTSTPRAEPAPTPVVVHFTTVKAPVAPGRRHRLQWRLDAEWPAARHPARGTAGPRVVPRRLRNRRGTWRSGSGDHRHLADEHLERADSSPRARRHLPRGGADGRCVRRLAGHLQQPGQPGDLGPARELAGNDRDARHCP